MRRTEGSEEFTATIVERVQRSGCEWLDAVMCYQQAKGLEPETVASLVKSSAVVKSNLLRECSILRLVETPSTLD